MGRQKTKDTARTFFTKFGKVEGLSQVVTVMMEDLQEMDSDSEKEEDRLHTELKKNLSWRKRRTLAFTVIRIHLLLLENSWTL